MTQDLLQPSPWVTFNSIGAPVSDPARWDALVEARRVGDRRSISSVHVPEAVKKP